MTLFHDFDNLANKKSPKYYIFVDSHDIPVTSTSTSNSFFPSHKKVPYILPTFLPVVKSLADDWPKSRGPASSSYLEEASHGHTTH